MIVKLRRELKKRSTAAVDQIDFEEDNIVDSSIALATTRFSRAVRIG